MIFKDAVCLFNLVMYNSATKIFLGEKLREKEHIYTYANTYIQYTYVNTQFDTKKNDFYALLNNLLPVLDIYNCNKCKSAIYECTIITM